MAVRFRAKRDQFKTVYGLVPESPGQNLALAALHVPCSLDSDLRVRATGQAAGRASGARASKRYF